MNPIQEIVSFYARNYNAEEVSGSLIATVNGQRQTIAYYDSTSFKLTPYAAQLPEVRDTLKLKRQPKE